MPPLPQGTRVLYDDNRIIWGGASPRYLQLIEGDGPVPVIPHHGLLTRTCPRYPASRLGSCCPAHGDGPIYTCCICGQGWTRAPTRRS